MAKLWLCSHPTTYMKLQATCTRGLYSVLAPQEKNWCPYKPQFYINTAYGLFTTLITMFMWRNVDELKMACILSLFKLYTFYPKDNYSDTAVADSLYNEKKPMLGTDSKTCVSHSCRIITFMAGTMEVPWLLQLHFKSGYPCTVACTLIYCYVRSYCAHWFYTTLRKLALA